MLVEKERLFEEVHICAWVFLLLIAGCEGETGTEGRIAGGDIYPEGKHQIIGEYDTFSGEFYKVLKLNKKKQYEFILKKRSESGILRTFIMDHKTKKVYGSDSDIMNFVPPHNGMYSIRIVGKKHKTGFKLYWKSDKATP